MTITKYPPRTIWLGGHRVEIGDIAASEAITPGHLVLRFNAAGVVRYKKHDDAGADCVRAVATEQSMLNKGVDDAYAAGDLMEVSELAPGSYAWMIIGSGENIAAGQQLQSAGNGKLTAQTGDGIPLFAATENKDNSAGPGDARIRVEVV
jgi:hypothetical protein